MQEQLMLGGDATIVDPPPVPGVVFTEHHTRTSIIGEWRNEKCAHCLMNKARFRADRASIPQWKTARDITVLMATAIITQTDGSTLSLCAQHADEHENRS